MKETVYAKAIFLCDHDHFWIHHTLQNNYGKQFMPNDVFDQVVCVCAAHAQYVICFDLLMTKTHRENEAAKCCCRKLWVIRFSFFAFFSFKQQQFTSMEVK